MVTQLDSTCRRGVVILLSSSAGQRRCPEAAGVKRNPMRPFEEFVEVARAQEPHCQYRQRRCYLDGIGIATDPVGRNGRITGIRCFYAEITDSSVTSGKMTEKCRVCGELAAGRARYLVEVSRLLWCAAGSGGDMQAAARECWSWEQEGRSPSRPLRMGEDGTGEGEPRFCGAQSGRRRYAELLRGFDARGSWRAGRPPDLPAREKNKVG